GTDECSLSPSRIGMLEVWTQGSCDTSAMALFPVVWADAGTAKSAVPTAATSANSTSPARAVNRPSGADADRALRTHEADGNSGLVLRSDTRDGASLPAGGSVRQVTDPGRAKAQPRSRCAGDTVVGWWCCSDVT